MSDTDSICSTPGIMALDIAERDNQIFKKPVLPAPRKRKKKVLDEETYVREVEKIIERDFFPDLENLKERVVYLEAKEANDIEKLREFYNKYATPPPVAADISNVQDSPATFETPDINVFNTRGDSAPSIDTMQEGTSNDSPSKIDKEITLASSSSESHQTSLDEFLATHTSEDNESFEQLMEKNEKRFRQKHAWMFEAEEKHNKNHLPNLILPSIKQQEEAEKLAITGTSVQSDSRPKQVENWNFKTFNSVMFVPNGDEVKQTKAIEERKKKKPEVVLGNTRYETNPFIETLSKTAMLEASAVQASKKEGKVGIDGKDLGKDSPKVNGYSFVKTPSPMPGVDASPLMTWGEIEGTPFQLDGNQTPLLKKHSTPGPSYRIPKVPNRDRIGHMLAEQVSQKHRKSKKTSASIIGSNINTPKQLSSSTPSSERLASMSSAAQNLLSAKLGARCSSTDIALRKSYTPSPISRRSKGSVTPIGKTPIKSSTPFFTSGTKKSERKTGVPFDAPLDLTDNLLDLPRKKTVNHESVENDTLGARKCAADYF